MMSYVVRIETDPETAHLSYKEFAGAGLYGPYDTFDDAQRYKELVEAQLAEVPDSALVYGIPTVTIETIVLVTPEAAARNWHLELV